MAKTSALTRTHGFGEAHESARADYLSRRGPAARRERAEQRARIAASVRSQQRSPLHPKALRMIDMTPGRKVIVFNREYGILEEGVVIKGPHAFMSGPGSSLGGSAVVWIFRTAGYNTGTVDDHSFCTDMGLEPYFSGWNDRNFTIDMADRNTLPAPDPSLRHRHLFTAFMDDEWDEYFGSEED